jgi:protein XagA
MLSLHKSKNHMRKNIYIFIYLFLGSIININGQAWTKAKGENFLKLDYSNISSKKYFDKDGTVVDISPLTYSTLSFYGELGLTDKITVVGYLPYVSNNFTDKNQKNSGIGDIDLAFRFALPINKVAVAVNVLLGLPTGNGTAPFDLHTGDGEFNQMIKIGAGSGGTKWWAQTAFGYNNRTKDFSDELRYDFEVGYKFFNERLLTMLKLNGVESLKNGTTKESATGLFSNNVAYSGIGPEFLYFLNSKKTFGVSLRLAGAFSGKYILAAPSTSFGIIGQL